ncbi:MAG: AroM protein [Candidatus Rokuibacteriota bacterium]|nr:MAG: AroM protein [Candidatus Rokubacteria bacterium]
MPAELRPVIGLVTIGQSPRVDIVPEMAAVIGPDVEVREAGALDGLSRAEIAALAPTGDDEILVTRLGNGTAVFLGKQKIVGHVETRIAALERGGATLTALLCTGAFPPLRATRALIQPQPVLLGTLRGMRWPGRLGVLTPSVPHVPQTEARWRRDGFDPVVIPLSPYEHEDAAALARVAAALRQAEAGLVVLDCMGFNRKTRDELRALTGAPVLLANLLVARVVAELCGA